MIVLLNGYHGNLIIYYLSRSQQHNIYYEQKNPDIVHHS